MNILFLITAVLFFIWIVRNAFFWVSLWQVKEYRLDRLIVHIKETTQGMDLFLSPLSILKWAAILAYLIVVLNNGFIIFYKLIVVFVFYLQFLFVFKELTTHSFKRPTFTIKAVVIISLSVIVLFLLFLIPVLDRFLWFLVLDRVLFLFVAFFVFSFSFPTDIYKDLQIDKATKKIKNHRNLLIIGVTGSYGKSSTKEYIAQILEKKFKVLKTQGTNNTAIGIANTVLSGLKEDTQVFVAEMAAYKKGEIKELCKIAKPKIGIITAVNNQHLSLFGSLQNTLSAKYELIRSLPKDGLAIFNGNNKNAYKLYKLTTKKKILYRLLGFPKKSREEGIFGFNIETKKTLIEFDISIGNESVHMETNLIGSHNVENILPAIYIAYYLGMNFSEIKKAVFSLSNLPKTMTKHELTTGATIIDDTFNANPNAVLAALEYMKIYKGRKIMVLQPMIELGEDSEKEHFHIAREISKVCDYLFLTNKNHYKSILEGVDSVSEKCIVQILDASAASKFIKESSDSDDIIIFEGKEAAIFLSKLLS